MISLKTETEVWLIEEAFKKSKGEFFDLVSSAEDYELVFDKIECKRKLEDYLKN